LAPLDNPFSADHYFYSRAQWKLNFAWLPHRCNLSNKIIWLQFGYIGEARWKGPGDDAVEYHWHTKTEHLIWCLKNG
jgi:uncharacterized cupin superfamily protein